MRRILKRNDQFENFLHQDLGIFFKEIHVPILSVSVFRIGTAFSAILCFVLKKKYRMLIYCMVMAGPHVFLEEIQCILFAVNVFIIVLFNLA